MLIRCHDAEILMPDAPLMRAAFDCFTAMIRHAAAADAAAPLFDDVTPRCRFAASDAIFAAALFRAASA